MTQKHEQSKTVPTQCAECEGTMEQQTITHEERDEHGMLYVIENVPALVCKQCGVVYFDASVDVMLDRVLESTKPVKKIQTPVFDYSKVKA